MSGAGWAQAGDGRNPWGGGAGIAEKPAGGWGPSAGCGGGVPRGAEGIAVGGGRGGGPWVAAKPRVEGGGGEAESRAAPQGGASLRGAGVR